jgi:TRAP-type C4-dicarboxylate transport system substrate-binding protein
MELETKRINYINKGYGKIKILSVQLDEIKTDSHQMTWGRICILIAVLMLSLLLVFGCSGKQKVESQTMEKKAAVDSSSPKYRCIVSNLSHPIIKGVFAGFAIRDELIKRTNGQVYFDYKPLSELGIENEVLKKLQKGTIQGMAISPAAASVYGPRAHLLQLPFLVNSFDKLDRFIASGKLFDHLLMALDHRGIMGLDITGFGNYGWATTIPVRTIADSKKVRFRTGETVVNHLLYSEWGFHPVAIPWPDVPIALKKGIIQALDHTPMVCNITKKFEVCKYYTDINYAQGLFIWIFNKAWFNKLPKDLQDTFVDVVHEVCADIRKQTKQQEEDQIVQAKEYGVEFISLSENDTNYLRLQGNVVHEQLKSKINKLYKGDKYRPDDYLRDVQNYLGYNNTW